PPPLPPGEYRLVATTSDTSVSTKYQTSLFFVTATNENWHSNYGQSKLHILPETKTYFAGQTARLFIQSPDSGPALLTLSNDQAISQKIISLTAPFTIIDLPIDQQHTPNLFVTVTSWQPNDHFIDTGLVIWKSEANLHYTRSTVKLNVPPHQQQLNLTITPDQKEYQAGQPATITLQATNHLGHPVATEIALAINPQQLYNNATLPQPLGPTFYPATPFRIFQYDSYALSRYRYGGCGCGDGGWEEIIDISQINYPTTLPSFWYPSHRTNALGQAQITLIWPDAPADWFLSAHAFTTDTQTGLATLSLSTQ
ncbi:MAG TPA: hypothetical protein VLL52_05155, partial [Anaerolineae bacterium]|nr:hypothetical protein [Anaerolineae bacterium]